MSARPRIQKLGGLGLSLLVAACGGEIGDRPEEKPEQALPADPGSRAFDCAVDDDFELESIEDWELGAGTGWYTNNEICEDCEALAEPERARCNAQCLAIQTPSFFEKPLGASRIEGGRCGSEWALSVRAGPMTDWGGVIGLQFGEPRDVSAFSGIAFWARVAPGSRGTLRLDVAEQHTDGERFLSGSPPCQPDADDDHLREKCDAFGAFAIASDRWRFVTLSFDEMRQSGFGVQAPYLDVWGLFGITFAYGLGEWQLWIDDVAFYRRKR
jgi:hypothetical protein